MGFEPTTLAILEEMSYQIDHRDRPIAIGIPNPQQRVPQPVKVLAVYSANTHLCKGKTSNPFSRC